MSEQQQQQHLILTPLYLLLSLALDHVQYLLPALDDVRGEDGAPQGHAGQAAGEDGAGGADVVLGLA